MACFATPCGLRYAAHCFNRAHAQQRGSALIPAGGKLGVTSAGIGCGLALACDFCVAAEDAYFLLAFVNIGLVPDGGVSWLLPHLAGRARAAEMLMLGEKVSAVKACEWGLVHKSVPTAALDSEARVLAGRLANGPTRALGAMKRNLAIALDHSLSGALQAEADAQRKLAESDDAKEGIGAFLQKRTPLFKGK